MDNTRRIDLPARDVPVLDDVDVVVCGGGPAGLGATVAAARAGARTLLVEQLYSVGGMATATAVQTWCDSPSGAVFRELEERVTALGQATRRYDPQAHVWPEGRVRMGGETVKAVAMAMLREAGARVLLGSVAAAPHLVDGRVAGVVLANKGGLSAALAPVVIDATADADLAHGAGARCLKGDPADGRLMHAQFMWRIEGVDQDRAAAGPQGEELADIFRQALAAGELTRPAGLFQPSPDAFPYGHLQSWAIDGLDASDPVAVSDCLSECQTIALQVVEVCRRRLPGYENCAVGRFWNLLGTRESRRVAGRYTLTGQDLLAGRKFPDGVARAAFFIDFHDSPPGRTVPYTLADKLDLSPPPGDWYEIPYRCLVPETVEGLLVAGRCISAEREALASLRIMPTCMFTGEAAGHAAALATAGGIPPHEVDGKAVRRQVLGDE